MRAMRNGSCYSCGRAYRRGDVIRPVWTELGTPRQDIKFAAVVCCPLPKVQP